MWPNKGTIIAPAALHLPLYDALLQEQHDLTGLQVLTLDAWMARFAPRQRSGAADLFAAKERLQPLKDNSFAGSFADREFLDACLKFKERARFLGIETFPDRTKKEKDLKQVLEALWEPEAVTLPEDLSDIWFLDTRYTGISAAWQKAMLQRGARLLPTPYVFRRRISWSASNIRKCAQAAAREIIEKEMKAEDVMVVLENDSDRYVLAQVFEQAGIPLTFLHPDTRSDIPGEFASILRYMTKPGPDTWLAMVRTLMPVSAADYLDYMEQFGPAADLAALDYEPNPVVSLEQFEQLRTQEERARQWDTAHDFMRAWRLNDQDLSAAGTLLQNLHPEPTPQDVAALDRVFALIDEVQNEIHTPQDGELLAQLTETLPVKADVPALQGVLAGTKSDISLLRATVFYIGPIARTFPGLQLENGLFDETYCASAGFEPLASRLQNQREDLYRILDTPETLYVVIPQSDYKGKDLEGSYELEQWLGQPPVFQHITDTSIWTEPAFKLTGLPSYKPSTISALDRKKQCPLRHYLRYGLHLKPEYPLNLDPGARMLESVLTAAAHLENIRFHELDETQVLALVNAQLAFARKVFVRRHKELDALALCQTARIMNLLPQFREFSTRFHLKLLNQQAQIPVAVKGGMDPWRRDSADFTVYDLDPASPLASCQMRVSLEAGSYAPFKINSRQANTKLEYNNQLEARRQQLDDRLLAGFTGQNFGEPDDPLLKKAAKKVPTFADRQTDIQARVDAFMKTQEVIAPVHEAGSCKNCPYRSICRNGAREKETV